MQNRLGKILLADPDVAIVKRLNDALRAQGWDMVNVKDGPRALELAVSTSPDLIILEIELPFLNGVRIAQILKSNPKMKDVPIIFMSSGDINPAYRSFFQSAVIQKPFDVDEVIARLNASLMRKEKALEVQVESKEIEGNLSQMSLVDILQIFSMNKKDGVIVVRKEDVGAEGMIFLNEGEIVNATVGFASGEKALYRLLTWDSGKFEYIPQNFHPEAVIDKATDSLLMEGMRQLDEWKRMSAQFPPMEALLYLKVDSSKFPSKLRPVTKEVIALLEFYNKVGDIVENSSESDYETMMTLHTLISKGVVEIRKKEVKKARSRFPILNSEEAFTIKENLISTLWEGPEMEMVKIPILADNIEYVRDVANLLAGIDGFVMEKQFFMGQTDGVPLGMVGSVKVSDGITLLFPAFPMDMVYSPLWEPLMGNSIGTLLLHGEGDTGNLERTNRCIDEALKLKALVLNMKEGASDLADAEIPQINMEEIEKEEVHEVLHRMLRLFLNLS